MIVNIKRNFIKNSGLGDFGSNFFTDIAKNVSNALQPNHLLKTFATSFNPTALLAQVGGVKGKSLDYLKTLTPISSLTIENPNIKKVALI